MIEHVTKPYWLAIMKEYAPQNLGFIVFYKTRVSLEHSLFPAVRFTPCAYFCDDLLREPFDYFNQIYRQVNHPHFLYCRKKEKAVEF